MSRTDRYLLKEVLMTFSATVLILLATVLSNRLAGYLSQAANGLLSQEAILPLLGLQTIRFIAILIPPALLLSIMLALGRLYRDHEMAALAACGVGPGSIYRPLFLLGVPLAVALTVLSLYVVPLCMALQYELQSRARQDAQVSMFSPGIFREVMDGQYVVYIGALADGGQELHKIFIHSRTHKGDIVITTGERGHQEIDTETGARYIVLNNGYRFEGSPGESDYRNLHFQRLAVLVDSMLPEQVERRQALPTTQLFRVYHPYYLSEFHERLGGPVSVLLIVFLAPLLAHAHPREGRYARVVAAILIYTIYSNLLGVGKSWLENSIIPITLGLWWVHGLFALLGLGLWISHYGIGLRPFKNSAITRETA